MKNRINSILEKLPKNIDAGIVTSGNSIYYLTGIRASAGVVVVTRQKSYLIIDFRYIELAKKNAKNVEVILQDDLNEQINEILAENNCKNVALETENISFSKAVAYKNKLNCTIVEGNDFDTAISEVRAIKTSHEVEAMKKAQQLTDETFSYILNHIKVGRTEKEIALEMEFHIRKLGAENVSFSYIVASGSNGSLPHAVPSDKQIENGDLLTMDFGCIVDGYCSDMTRTVGIGDVSDKQRSVYDIVLNAQKKTLAAIKHGVKCKEIDAIARNIITENGYGDCFGHGLGHCIGIEVHESPRCSRLSEDTLITGMVTSVEPGIYVPGEMGVRIEDVTLVTETGNENFTNSTTDLIIL